VKSFGISAYLGAIAEFFVYHTQKLEVDL